MKRFVWPLLILLLVAGFFGWRATRPQLSPEEQISRQLTGLEESVEAKNVRGIAGYLAADFVYEGAGGASRKDVLNGARGTLFQARDVQVDLSNVQTQVNGNKASSSGDVRMSLRPSPNAAVETRTSNFALDWELRDGTWKIVRARGGDNLATL